MEQLFHLICSFSWDQPITHTLPVTSGPQVRISCSPGTMSNSYQVSPPSTMPLARSTAPYSPGIQRGQDALQLVMAVLVGSLVAPAGEHFVCIVVMMMVMMAAAALAVVVVLMLVIVIVVIMVMVVMAAVRGRVVIMLVMCRGDARARPLIVIIIMVVMMVAALVAVLIVVMVVVMVLFLILVRMGSIGSLASLRSSATRSRLPSITETICAPVSSFQSVVTMVAVGFFSAAGQRRRQPSSRGGSFGAAQDDAGCVADLVVIELAKVLHIHFDLVHIGHSHKAVQADRQGLAHTLNSAGHITQLANAGRLDQDAVRVIGLHDLFQCLAEVAHQEQQMQPEFSSLT